MNIIFIGSIFMLRSSTDLIIKEGLNVTGFIPFVCIRLLDPLKSKAYTYIRFRYSLPNDNVSRLISLFY